MKKTEGSMNTIGINHNLDRARIKKLLSFGNAFTFGGLLATLPDQEKFDRFQESYPVPKSI